MRRARLLVAAIVVVLAATAVPATAASAPHRILGTVTLTQSDNGWSYQSLCAGSGGYDDLRGGAQVRVTDGNGHLLALTELHDGHLDQGSLVGDLYTSCTFFFQVKVPPHSKFYGIEVSHRGAVDYSLAKMKRARWTVQLSIGS